MARSLCSNQGIRFGRGTKHVAVRTVQEALNNKGAQPQLSVDGDFGKRTERAVLKFQMDEERVQGVTGGIVDPQTLFVLRVLESVSEQIRKAPIPEHVETNDWQIKLGYDRISLGQTTVGPNLGQVTPATGSAFKLYGFETLLGGRIENVKGTWIFHGKDDPDRGDVTKNECALLVQAFGCGRTRNWRRGPHVRALRHIPRGTVVATLRDGVYYSDHSGRSHVGIFDSFISGANGQPKGFRMFDQSNGNDIKLRDFNFFDAYDRSKMVEKPKGKSGDLTIPVYGPNNELLGYTVIEDPFYAKNKFRWTSIGDEYYVMYSNDEPNLVIL